MTCLLVATACQTKPKIEWNSWVGNTSYDDVVRRLGPPEKETKLSDGSRVGDWFLNRGQLISTFQSMPDGRIIQGSAHQFPDRLMRLTFDKEDIMRSWKRVYR